MTSDDPFECVGRHLSTILFPDNTRLDTLDFAPPSGRERQKNGRPGPLSDFVWGETADLQRAVPDGRWCSLPHN